MSTHEPAACKLPSEVDQPVVSKSAPPKLSGGLRTCRLAIAAFMLQPAIALAQGVPSLAVPVQCEIGKVCVLQNYLDHDPEPDTRD